MEALSATSNQEPINHEVQKKPRHPLVHPRVPRVVSKHAPEMLKDAQSGRVHLVIRVVVDQSSEGKHGVMLHACVAGEIPLRLEYELHAA